jgi:plasmid stabilization system protein ParE
MPGSHSAKKRRALRLGRIDYEQPDERELLIAFGDSGYVARYRLEGSTVLVLAIRHAREAGYTMDR